jgi:hypothetical protein
MRIINDKSKMFLNSKHLKSVDQLTDCPIGDVKVISDGGSAVHCVPGVEFLLPGSITKRSMLLEFGDGRTVQTEHIGTLLLQTESGNFHLRDTIVIPGCPCIIISEPLFDLAGVGIGKKHGKILFEQSNGEVLMSGRLNVHKQYEMAVQPIQINSVNRIAPSIRKAPSIGLSICESMIWPFGPIATYVVSLIGRKMESGDSPF